MRLPLLLALLLVASGAAAQTALAPGDAIDADLATGDAHAYTLDLDADQFVLGAAMQHTVDVVVTLTGPDGETIEEFDQPARGAENFQFTTETAGAYALTVTPFEDEEGRYTMTLARVEPVATTPDGIVDQTFAVLDRGDSPGAIVAVAQRGELVFAKPFGMANLTHGVAYTLDTPTNIGSTSKQFTAFAIGLLAERGELSMDDDVRTHIPELPDLGETITLRHLMTHTSGYREFLNALAMGGVSPETIQRREIIELLQRQPELQNVPGEEWNYNNSAFGLLATVVERVSGEGFPAWMRENVFLPLGMENTYVRESPTTVIPGRAAGYIPAEGGGWQEVPDLGGAMGAGGMYSTAPDLAKWMDNYRTARLGGEGLIREMTTPYVLASGDTTEYGLGLFIDEMRGQPRWQHGGADMAHRSAFEYLPEVEMGLIVLSNSPAVPNSDGRIAEAFLGDHLEPEEDDAPEAPAEDFDPESFDPETFDAYAGRYSMDEMPTFVLTFRRDGERYLIQPTGQPESEVFPIAPNQFESRIVDANVVFHVEDDGTVSTITLNQNGAHPGTRLDDEVAEAGPLADYTGRFFSEELEVFYTISETDGELHLMHRRMEEPVGLEHNSGDGFTGGFPIATLDFERDDAGQVTGFHAGNGRTRGVWFEKVEGQ
ncbi:MAG: serine hydrolase [Bacteroidota bacterium]